MTHELSIMTTAELYKIYQKYPSIQTDSRKVKPSDLFFALKGPNFNGNLFAEKAIADGAAYAIVDEPPAAAHSKIICVPDVLEALQALAGHHRSTFDIPFIAITGSNGKTTTKELVHQVLSAQYITATTEGNLNNHIGIPLTLLRIQRDAEIAVIEMGANHLREIASYCSYTRPTLGIITNCGKAHLEGFGSEAGVRKGKGELFDYLRSTGGACFAYADYAYFEEMTKGLTTVHWYGSDKAPGNHELEVQGAILKSDPFLSIALQSAGDAAANAKVVDTQLVGSYNLPNVLCAIATGKYFNIDLDKISKAIADYAPSNSRSQLIHRGSNQIILDAYNANPSSMKVAVDNFAAMRGASKVLILGGMKELGADSEAEHKQLLAQITRYSWAAVTLIGPEFKDLLPVGRSTWYWFADQKEARNWFLQQHFADSLILIKGSRSNALEKILGS